MIKEKVSISRQKAVDILTQWQQKSASIDQLRDSALKKDKSLSDLDRRFLTELLYGTVRQLSVIDGILEKVVTSRLDKMQQGLLAILRLGSYQIMFMDRVPTHSVVDESVKIAKAVFGTPQGGLVNAVLRKVANQPVSTRPVDAFNNSTHPLWRWRSKWEEQWGKEKAEELIGYFKQIPIVGLRRNLLRTDSDDAWLTKLSAEGVSPAPIPEWPGHIYAKGVIPGQLDSFNKGITTSQDPAAGIAPRVLDPQSGEKILDMCSAPGGKTALLWELMEGKGSLTAIDRSMKRNRLTRQTLERLGHSGVQIETGDAILYHETGFDRVLVDVPCSGTGVAHRRPDLLIRRNPKDVMQLAKMQRSILQHAAEAVRPGGVLVYSTCSLEPEENRKIAAYLDKRLKNEFERDELPEIIPERWRKGDGIAETWPPVDRVDGVFVVRWRRRT